MPYWLMKSEPSELSIDDLAAMPNQTIPWVGVRNFQARNFMRDSMKIGDRAFFYHSSCPEPGIVGLVEVASLSHVDETQFDSTSKYFDPKSTKSNPRWINVDVRLIRKTKLLSLGELRQVEELKSMQTLAKGNRLSITPVTDEEWHYINKRLA